MISCIEGGASPFIFKCLSSILSKNIYLHFNHIDKKKNYQVLREVSFNKAKPPN